jgi:hypothetical protein
VADRGFAGADFFIWMIEHHRHFVVRFQGKTHVTIPDGKGSTLSGAVKDVVDIKPGERRWIQHVEYRKDGVVRVNLLVVLDKGQKEVWYLATNWDNAEEVEQMYRWRMREEREYKDCKDQLLLGAKGTRMTVRNTLSAAGLLDALMVLHWFVALAGLQAMRDLPAAEVARNTGEGPLAGQAPAVPVGEANDAQGVEMEGPAIAPEPDWLNRESDVPHWLRRFQAWGPISYVKLGLEYLRLPNIAAGLVRLVAWIRDKLSPYQPLLTRRQARYRAALSRFG